VSAGLFHATDLIAADPSSERLALFQQLGIFTSASNVEAASAAKIVMLCTKPQMMGGAVTSLKAVLQTSQLIVSIAAGLSTGFIARELSEARAWRIVRVMPNTPMLYGTGATAICKGQHASDYVLSRVRGIFQSASKVIEVEEPLMDAVTAVSGSGPAYFFYLVENMIAAAVELGLSPEQAKALVVQTATGAAKMLSASTDSAAELRAKVTSPGGTTQAALEVFHKAELGTIVQRAIAAAEQRGRELGR